MPIEIKYVAVQILIGMRINTPPILRKKAKQEMIAKLLCIAQDPSAASFDYGRGDKGGTGKVPDKHNQE